MDQSRMVRTRQARLACGCASGVPHVSSRLKAVPRAHLLKSRSWPGLAPGLVYPGMFFCSWALGKSRWGAPQALRLTSLAAPGSARATPGAAEACRRARRRPGEQGPAS